VTRPILVGCAALFLVAALSTLGSMVALARVDALAKPSVMSCTGPVPHVEVGR
jgi:hypothetical protein